MIREHDVIHNAQVMVRETGYHVARLNVEGNCGDECYSRSYSLYVMACDWLRIVTPDTAQAFIDRTYKPAQLK